MPSIFHISKLQINYRKNQRKDVYNVILHLFCAHDRSALQRLDTRNENHKLYS